MRNLKISQFGRLLPNDPFPDKKAFNYYKKKNSLILCWIANFSSMNCWHLRCLRFRKSSMTLTFASSAFHCSSAIIPSIRSSFSSAFRR